jgi:hypothetical protein
VGDDDGGEANIEPAAPIIETTHHSDAPRDEAVEAR